MVVSSSVSIVAATPTFFEVPWSPDGAKIAYCLRAGERPSVWVMDADGKNEKMVYWWGDGPEWSPDGDKIAFASYQDSRDNWGSNDIYVIDADGENLERLTKPGPLYGNPRWSADGTRIAFFSDQDGNWDLYVMDADGLKCPAAHQHSRG